MTSITVTWIVAQLDAGKIAVHASGSKAYPHIRRGAVVGYGVTTECGRKYDFQTSLSAATFVAHRHG